MSHWADIIDNLNVDAEWHEVAAKKSREYGGDGYVENTAIADAHRRAAKLLTDCQDIAAEIRRAKEDAWDEGAKACDRDWLLSFDIVSPDEDRKPWPNPYRKADP